MVQGVRALDTVRHDEVFTATETDVLSDTDLDRAPGPGAVGIWAASDVIDSTITVRIGGKQQTTAAVVPNTGTGAPINTEDSAPYARVAVRGGEKIRVDVAETAAMNLRLIVIWAGALP